MKKTVVITGGTSGFGLATAKAFKNAGYTVLITARSKDKLEQAQKESGADFIFVQDVKNYNEWLALYDFAKKNLGDIDVIVNNAGSGLSILPIEEQSKDNIDAIIATNLTSVVYSAQVFAKDMKTGSLFIS